MRRRSSLPQTSHTCILLLLTSCGGARGHEPILPYDPLVYVNPMIGTGGIGFGQGSVYPGPTLPYGLAKPSPDTTGMVGAMGVTHCSGYWYEDGSILGFSQVHLYGTGAPDYGSILLFPADGWSPLHREDSTRSATFSHQNEHAAPGFYDVTFDNGIRTEITVTLHGAVYRVTWPAGADPVLVWDLEHTLNEEGAGGGHFSFDTASALLDMDMWNHGALSGRSGGFPTFAHVSFDKKVSEVGTWSEGEEQAGSVEAQGIDVGGWLRFQPENTTSPLTVEIQVGLSFTSAEQASANHAAELSGRTFDELLSAAEQSWREVLGRVRVQGGDDAEMTIFHTALYHAFMMPDLLSDADGSYIGFDGALHVEPGDPFYSDMSLWDTYRTLHPLLILAWPEYQRAFNRSLVRMAAQGGYLPRWPCNRGYTGCMVGEPAQIVLAESLLKGVDGWDESAAFEAAQITADGPVPSDSPYGGRGGIESYLAQGYVAGDLNDGATSLTLEYAWADHALGRWAAATFREQEAARYMWRANSWRNTWDPDIDFFRSRLSSGEYEDPSFFSESRWEEDYVEGNAWQYLWMVPYDPQGLAELMGGPDALLERLDLFFEESLAEPDTALSDIWYWHGNEPDIHTPYLYALLDQPERGSPWVRWVRETRYNDQADGLDGNDDGGTLSTWYVWSALGLYPVAGTDIYALGPPLFDRAEVDLPSGDTIEIQRQNEHGQPGVWAGLLLDGKPVEGGTLRHDALRDGARLVFMEGPPESPLQGARASDP